MYIHRFSKVLINRNIFKHRQAFPNMASFLFSVENVILTIIVNTGDSTCVGCDMWQMECYADIMADGKALYTDDTT